MKLEYSKPVLQRVELVATEQVFIPCKTANAGSGQLGVNCDAGAADCLFAGS